MVIRLKRKRKSAALIIEIIVAIGILAAASLPLAFSIAREQRLARAAYFQAVAMEIVDGEMELLRAGEWRSFHQGLQPYLVRLNAAANLPRGQFVLTLKGNWARLEWRPAGKGKGVSREARLK